MQRIIECRITAEHSNVPKARKSAEKSKRLVFLSLKLW